MPDELTTKAIVLPARAAPATHLVVLLHGMGVDAASFEDVGRALGAVLPRAELVVPDGFHAFDGGGDGRQWFSVRGVTDENRPARIRKAGAEVSPWIDAELARRRIGGERLVVIGFSQGATVAGWLAVHRTPRPAAVVMLSGRVAEDQAATPGARATPILIAHGDRDRVMPVSGVEPAARVLEAWGARVTTRVYPGLGHQIDARVLRDAGDFVRSVIDET